MLLSTSFSNNLFVSEGVAMNNNIKINRHIRKIIVPLGLMLIFTTLVISGLFYINNNPAPIETLYNLKRDRWAEVGKDIYVCRGEVSENMTLVVSGNEGILIDAGYIPAFGNISGNNGNGKGIFKMKDFIKEKNLKISHVIITHDDLDHYYGTMLFFNKLKENFEDSVTLDVRNTTDGQLVKIGDRTLKIISTPGHATIYGGHISVELVEEHILVSGDVIYSNFLPGLREQDSSLQLITTLEKLKKSKYSMIIPGHGNIIEPVRVIDRHLKYLYRTRKLVKRIVDRDGGLIDVYHKVEVKDCTKDLEQITWGDALRMHRDNLVVIYEELKAEKNQSNSY
jgi:glyoxylase-like metal-dependent hydrolase (beta-lactamase superfamily II)